MNYYIEVLKKYAVFSGRSRRSEYWYFVLFNLIVSIILSIIGPLIGLKSILSIIYALIILIPGLAVAVRRLHDIGKSGWMILVSLIPLAGIIWLIVLFCLDSNPSDNKYGPNPKTSPLPTPSTPTQGK